jgi:hypothetical protein
MFSTSLLNNVPCDRNVVVKNGFFVGFGRKICKNKSGTRLYHGIERNRIDNRIGD